MDGPRAIRNTWLLLPVVKPGLQAAHTYKRTQIYMT